MPTQEHQTRLAMNNSAVGQYLKADDERRGSLELATAGRRFAMLAALAV